MDDHFGKLSEDSDLMYKRCGVSTSFRLLLFCVDFLSLCWCSPQALNKKEHRGCDSPDPDASYVLTPHTEEKYKKINEEFDNMMRNHKIVSTVNATFLLGFVAQKDFLVFIHLTFCCSLVNLCQNYTSLRLIPFYGGCIFFFSWFILQLIFLAHPYLWLHFINRWNVACFC